MSKKREARHLRAKGRGARGIAPLALCALCVLAAAVVALRLAAGPRASDAGAADVVADEGARTDATQEDAEAMQVVETQGDAATDHEPARSEFMQRVLSGEYASIRLVGDSITAGYGTDGYVDPDIDPQTPVIYDDGAGETHHESPATVACWANEFRAWATAHGIEDFCNAGISGWFMHQLAQKPDAWLMGGADVVVVALGTNDAGYYGTAEFADDAAVALAAAAASSKLVVVLAPVADLRPEGWLVEPATELGDVLGRLCEECGYVFVDPREAVGPELFCDDGLHPSTAGSHAIWECLSSTLGLE